MPYTVIVHISNEDPIVGEVDELPSSIDTLIMIRSPRRRDGKDVHYLQNSVVTVYLPVSQITFIEVLPSQVEEDVIKPYRDKP
jgi:hypothetical protein